VASGDPVSPPAPEGLKEQPRTAPPTRSFDTAPHERAGVRFRRRLRDAFEGRREVQRESAEPFVEPPHRVRRAFETFRLSTGASARRARAAVGALQPEDTEGKVMHAGLVLSALGLCLVLFVAYVFVFTGLQEARAQHLLLEQFTGPARANIELSQHLKEGQPAALLEIPEIGVHLVVVKGTSATDLTSGPGLMSNTALPGTQGNSVIAGRRSTGGAPFGRLGDLHRGDEITVVTGLGKFDYKVTRVGTATSGQVDPISPTSGPRLTLVTSDPPLLATGRLFVVGRLVSPAARAPIPATPPTQSQRALAGDSSAIVPAIFWGLVLVGFLFFTIAAYRRWADQVWTVYLLSTPVMLAIALLFFECLYRLLPATL
jgi:sortase A